jgi:hypothetical protein
MNKPMRWGAVALVAILVLWLVVRSHYLLDSRKLVLCPVTKWQ